MNAHLHTFVAIILAVMTCQASTVEEQAEPPQQRKQAGPFMADVRQTSYFRDGRAIAAKIESTIRISDKKMKLPPMTERQLVFFIGERGRVRINLDDPHMFTIESLGNARVSRSKGSIVVWSLEHDYYEWVFFLPDGGIKFDTSSRYEETKQQFMEGIRNSGPAGEPVPKKRN